MVSFWEKTGRRIDWFIRGHFIVTLLISAGVGAVVRWIVGRYAQISPQLAAAIWLFASAAALWILLRMFQKRIFVQQDGIQAAGATGMEPSINAVVEFYKTCGGPFLDEMEAHFQRLAAHHKDQIERERFLIKALAAGGRLVCSRYDVEQYLS
ncbi:MAG: hypothetical protein M3O85_06340 [Acidobacteriota bacterium]|nr:hypothetical protein [Acidobacteriota bacterium]